LKVIRGKFCGENCASEPRSDGRWRAKIKDLAGSFLLVGADRSALPILA